MSNLAAYFQNIKNMLRDKITTKISELQTDFSSNLLDGTNVLKAFKALRLSNSFSEFNSLKKRGYCFKQVLSSLIWMVTQVNGTVNSSLSTLFEKGVHFKKDVYYRLKNNEKICWRRILFYIGERFLSVTQEDRAKNSTNESSTNYRCLIFDDTLLEKTGKLIENIGRVYDHVTNSTVLGFKLLLALYWDGTSALPLDFSLLREKGKREDKPFGMTKKDLRRQYSKKRMRESESYSRIKELDMSKIELAIRMFFRVIFHCIPVDYVLCDSWFTCEALITSVRSTGSHLIGMYKFVTTKFEYRGRKLSYLQIMHSAGKEKRCKKFKLYYKRATVTYNGEQMTLFFSKVGCNGKWKVILTTDTKLSFMQLIEIYQIRWSIEVFFKEAKQLLNLGACQSSNFDAQLADATISMIAYLLLAFRYRYDNYESMGALFRAMSAEDLRQTLDIRLWEIFLELLTVICEVFEKDIDEMMELVMRSHKAAKLVENMLTHTS
jgi:hypothetical protein